MVCSQSNEAQDRDVVWWMMRCERCGLSAWEEEEEEEEARDGHGGKHGISGGRADADADPVLLLQARFAASWLPSLES